MRKSFALCEAFGLTPFPREAPRRAAEGHSPPGLDDQAAGMAVSGGEALRPLHCAARRAVQGSLRAAPRGEDLKEAGGRRPPASLRSSPRGAARSDTWPALRAAQCKCRYGLLREGQGWGWRTTTAVRHTPVARP